MDKRMTQVSLYIRQHGSRKYEPVKQKNLSHRHNFCAALCGQMGNASPSSCRTCSAHKRKPDPKTGLSTPRHESRAKVHSLTPQNRLQKMWPFSPRVDVESSGYESATPSSLVESIGHRATSPKSQPPHLVLDSHNYCHIQNLSFDHLLSGVIAQ
jgi:hypothetical protein